MLLTSATTRFATTNHKMHAIYRERYVCSDWVDFCVSQSFWGQPGVPLTPQDRSIEYIFPKTPRFCVVRWLNGRYPPATTRKLRRRRHSSNACRITSSSCSVSNGLRRKATAPLWRACRGEAKIVVVVGGHKNNGAAYFPAVWRRPWSCKPLWPGNWTSRIRQSVSSAMAASRKASGQHERFRRVTRPICGADRHSSRRTEGSSSTMDIRGHSSISWSPWAHELHLHLFRRLTLLSSHRY